MGPHTNSIIVHGDQQYQDYDQEEKGDIKLVLEVVDEETNPPLSTSEII
jgi:hypothetical protein